MNRLGIALVISAPSGTGKTTLIKRLRKEFPNFGYSTPCSPCPVCGAMPVTKWTRA